jgi:hypothetical protein
MMKTKSDKARGVFCIGFLDKFLSMSFYGTFAQKNTISNFTVGVSLSDQVQYVQFPF